MKREDPLTNHTEYALSLLVLWWRWESGWNHVEGYPVECPSTAGYRASRQYDDANGALETDERGKMAAGVGRLVESMPEPYRTALYLLARNRATGLAVWTSLRLPHNKDERAQIVSEALARFERMV